MLNHLAEFLRMPDGRRIQLSGDEPSRSDESVWDPHYVTEFRLEEGLPVWRYEFEGHVLEKKLLLVQGQNTLHVTYRIVSEGTAPRLEIQPSIHFRPHEQDVASPHDEGYLLRIEGTRYE